MISSVVLFDIDGTLINANGAGSAGARRAMQSAFGAEPTSGNISFAGRTDRGIVNELFELHSIENSEENWQKFQTHYLEHLTQTVVEQAGMVLPGVPELLDEISTPAHDDIAVGLLTGNTQPAAEIKLTHFDLHHYFSFGGFGDEAAYRNDSARSAYEIAQQHLQITIEPDRVLVIGDTPADIACARAIGARVLALTTGSFSRSELATEKPDALFDDLTNMNEVIQLIHS